MFEGALSSTIASELLFGWIFSPSELDLKWIWSLQNLFFWVPHRIWSDMCEAFQVEDLALMIRATRGRSIDRSLDWSIDCRLMDQLTDRSVGPRIGRSIRSIDWVDQMNRFDISTNMKNQNASFGELRRCCTHRPRIRSNRIPIRTNPWMIGLTRQKDAFLFFFFAFCWRSIWSFRYSFRFARCCIRGSLWAALLTHYKVSRAVVLFC